MKRQRGELVPVAEALAGQTGPVPAIREASPQAWHHFTLSPCSLPRTNPGNRHQYKRVNGPYKLVMIAGADNKLPYGNLPRLLIAWMCTEAVRTQSPRVDPGFFAVRVHGQAGYGFRRRRGAGSRLWPQSLGPSQGAF